MHRDSIKEEVKVGPPDVITPPEVWNLLSEEEKQVRREKYAEEEEARQEEAGAFRKNREDTYKGLLGADQIQFALDIKQGKVNEVIKSRLELKPMTLAEKT